LAQHDLSEELYANVANWATYPGYTDAERVVLEYTEKFLTDHLTIDQTLFDRLRKHFTDEFIFEMTLCIAGWSALGRVMQVMDASVSCPLVIG
jgi:alkylhydroperoxidase family enzyme